jgi:hypothetical protein
LEISGVVAGGALEVGAEELLEAGAGVCCARRGKAASTMVISKQHFHPRCFIAMCAPLRLGCTRLGRGYAEKETDGDHHFCDSDYTRADLAPHLEICIRQIHFSDSLLGRPEGSPGVDSTPSSSDANLTPGNSLRGLLASRRGHRIMHRVRKPAAGIVLAKRSDAALARTRFSSKVL